MKNRTILRGFSYIWGVVLVGLLPSHLAVAFDLSTCLIPKDEIRSGGPDRDDIPALVNPRVLSASKASYLYDDDRIIGVKIGRYTRAYPLRILNWHEVVNDKLGRKPIAVTYCPLCDSAVVFDRVVDGKTLVFGVSGLLYNSNVLLYNRRSGGRGESLWSQLQMRAVTGLAAKKGLTLKALPAELTTWADWRSRHPKTTILSDRTRDRRPYHRNPYRYYFSNDELMFQVNPKPDPKTGLLNKDKLVVVKVGSAVRAYPLKTVALLADTKGVMEDTLGKIPIRLTYIEDADTVRVESLSKRKVEISVAYTFWFAWYAMYPDSELFEPREQEQEPDKPVTTSRAAD